MPALEYAGKRHFTSLRSDLSPEECRRRLSEAVDVQRWAFSLSGYRGSRPVLAKLGELNFRLEKRRFWRNDFAPQFFGALEREGRGTVIEGYFDISSWARIWLRVWLALAILMGGGVFFSMAAGILQHRLLINPGTLGGLFVPVALLLFGFAMPRFGLWLSLSEESFLVAFLETTLVAVPYLQPGQVKSL